MGAEERRRKIAELLRKSEKPLSGTALAERCDVRTDIP